MEINQIFIFILSSVILVFTPGPDIFHVLARGVGQGKTAGFAAVTGCSLGNLVHTTLAVLGLSSLLASSQTAFALIKTAGAVYLIYIGIKLFREPFVANSETKNLNDDFFKIFRQAAITNILNPKVGLFFLAFIPQFVSSDAEAPGIQFLCLGLLFVGITFIGFTLITLCSGKIHSFVIKNPMAGKRMHKISGAMIFLLGLKIAFDGKSI